MTNEWVMGLPKRDARPEEMVSIDLEIANIPEGKTHRPVGDFKIMSIAMEDGGLYALTDVHDVREALKRLDKGTWAFHNALFDLRQLQRWADIPERFVWDTMLVERILYNGYYNDYGLGDLARRYFDVRLDKHVRKYFINMDGSVTLDQLEYAVDDAFFTLQSALVQRETFEKMPSELWRIYTDVDEPMIWTVLAMPPAKVDVDAWRKADEEHQRLATEYETDLGFNVYSPQQTVRAMNKYGFKVKDSKAETLEAFMPDPFVDKIILARRFRKAVSTYGVNWIENHVEDGDFVYSSWMITGANTGRMASGSPNLQNIPSRHLPIYRTFFIPSTSGGYMLVSDVSQQEPRITCFMSGDEELLQAFINDEDIHQFVATRIEQPRNIGKAINLGSTYGLTAFGLAKKLNVSTRKAEEFLSAYFNRFQGVHRWIGRTRTNARFDGFVTTPYGRRAYINTFNETQWDKQAINYPIQGGAGDQTKMSVTMMRKMSEDKGLPFTVCLVVHDEVVQDNPKGTKREYTKIANDAWLESAGIMFPGVPFKADTKTGQSWAVGKE